MGERTHIKMVLFAFFYGTLSIDERDDSVIISSIGQIDIHCCECQASLSLCQTVCTTLLNTVEIVESETTRR